jgi:hypothetical protein
MIMEMKRGVKPFFIESSFEARLLAAQDDGLKLKRRASP